MPTLTLAFFCPTEWVSWSSLLLCNHAWSSNKQGTVVFAREKMKIFVLFRGVILFILSRVWSMVAIHWPSLFKLVSSSYYPYDIDIFYLKMWYLNLFPCVVMIAWDKAKEKWWNGISFWWGNLGAKATTHEPHVMGRKDAPPSKNTRHACWHLVWQVPQVNSLMKEDLELWRPLNEML